MISVNDWGWRRPEQGLDPLVEWIDSVHSQSPNQKWGLWGGIVGGAGGIMGMSMGVMAGTPAQYSPAFFVPVALWALVTAGMTFWVLKKVRHAEGAWAQESRGMMTRVLVARWQGHLRSTLGEEGAQIMNEAAKLLLKCRSTLNSPAWKVAADGEIWGKMGDRVLKSMESAMARLLIQVTSGSLEETGPIVADMQAMTEEVSKAAARHSQITGLQTGGADGLRQALADMRELAQADEEVMRIRTEN